MDKPNILISPEELKRQLAQQDQVIVDLSKPELYAAGHIPGAVHLDYAQVVRHQPPVMGLLPDESAFGQALAACGITPETRVIAYDDEGGGKAGRLLWTLAACGHKHWALLDGGRGAWQAIAGPLEKNQVIPEPAPPYPVSFAASPVVAERDYILAHLDDPGVALLDARSAAEYQGLDRRATRAGHIPGAVNLDWLDLMDRQRQLRLKSAEQLLATLAQLGIRREQEVIVYCHSHHRSALSFVALKALGFEQVRGYPGAWSDWGNQPDTPIET